MTHHEVDGAAGPLSKERLRELYAQAAIVVVPLLETDFQAGITTTLEAMSMGKALVVSGTAGQTDVVVNGVNGLVVPPGDPVSMREAIYALMADRDLRRRLGEHARWTVEDTYSVDAYSHRLASELEASGSRNGLPEGFRGGGG
jgi:glycosyltransferase involved in cell wall biosynthesis